MLEEYDKFDNQIVTYCERRKFVKIPQKILRLQYMEHATTH